MLNRSSIHQLPGPPLSFSLFVCVDPLLILICFADVKHPWLYRFAKINPQNFSFCLCRFRSKK
jgi:hypothetical protein